jgi:esterase/lipase
LNWIVNSPEEVDQVIYDLMKTDAEIRWAIQDSLWKFGSDTPHELFLKGFKYNLKDCVKKIQCPMLVIDSEKEQFFAGQPQKLYDALQSPKKFMLFTVEESAEEHCQAGASSLSNQKIYDWLDNIFGI